MSALLPRSAITVVKWERNILNPCFLSYWFTEFYKGEPWNEYLMCPRCKDPNDYSSSHTYGIEEVTSKSMKTCPVCGENLVLFWGQERVFNYLFRKSNSDGELVFYKGEIAAWWRGYPIRQSLFYIDVVALLPKFRKSPGTRIFLEEFKGFLQRKRCEGYWMFITRTHKNARNVRVLLHKLGFCEDGPSREDPNRTYWYLY